MSYDLYSSSDDEETFLRNEAQERHVEKVSHWYEGMSGFFTVIGFESAEAAHFQEITSTELQQAARLCAENSRKFAAYFEKVSSVNKIHTGNNSKEDCENKLTEKEACENKAGEKKCFNLEDTARSFFEMSCKLKSTPVLQVTTLISDTEILELENTANKLTKTSGQLIEASHQLSKTSSKLEHTDSLVQTSIFFKHTAALCEKTASKYKDIARLQKEKNLLNQKICNYFDDESTIKFMCECD